MAELTPYESQQIEEIANWKSERASLAMSAYRAITNPLTNVFARVLPVPLVRALIAKAQVHAETHDGMAEMLDGFGVSDFRQLFNESLEIHQVDNAARRAFQERWLYDHGKVARIRPAAISCRRSSILGLVLISREVSYMGGYSLGFGATFSCELASKGVAALPANPAVDGLRDGATAAARDATKVRGRGRATAPVSVPPASASDAAVFAPATG